MTAQSGDQDMSQISDVEIAKLVNNEVSDEERERLLAVVQADPESYAVFLEASAFARQAASVDEPVAQQPVTSDVDERAPLRFPDPATDGLSQSSGRGWGRIAAALAAAAGLLVLVLRIPAFLAPAVPVMVASDLAESVMNRLSADQQLDVAQQVDVTLQRSAFADATTPAERAVRLGALDVELAIGRAAGARAIERSAARDTIGELQAMPSVEPTLISFYDRQSDPSQAEATLDRVAQSERLAELSDRSWFVSGQLLQALRLVASAGDEEALAELAHQEALQVLESLELEGVATATRQSLLREVLRTPADMSAIERLASDLLANLMG